MKPFCAWGDGPDVGINLFFPQPVTYHFIDMTAKEARELARKLIACAQEAEALESYCEEHDATSNRL